MSSRTYMAASSELGIAFKFCGKRNNRQADAPTHATASAVDFAKIYGNGATAGTLNFANWEDYIDVDSKGNSPSLEQFTKETGIKVNFTVLPENDVRDKISQEFSSQAGQYDIASVSNFEIPIQQTIEHLETCEISRFGV